MPKTRSNIDMIEPLKFWRNKRGYSQAKLAKMAQTSALTIGQLESGKRKGRGKTLSKILQGLGVSEDEFFNMREADQPAVSQELTQPAGEPAARPSASKEGSQFRLSNLDLELLNRILNLDFNSKLEALRFLQGLS
ncbi:MAG: XRE family transcriptional regulator [Candidatus Zixiibacteriota bacterium]|nr:MAG: XRE family transcriptional regulator [candidate division Zixibacteria bacterium]